MTANNLSNVLTPGFSAQLSALRAVPVDGPSLATRTLVTSSTLGADMSQGALNYTSRPLDVALQQDGFLALILPDGSEAYTRNGNIQVSSTGQLMVEGMLLMDDSGPIEVPPSAEITIASDSTISALNVGDPPNTIAQIGRLKLVKSKEREMMRGDDGLFHLTP